MHTWRVPRKIPLSMKDDVKSKLDTLEEQGMIEKVEHPTQWINHLQQVKKPSETVRHCLESSSRMYCFSWQERMCSACAMRKTLSYK